MRVVRGGRRWERAIPPPASSLGTLGTRQRRPAGCRRARANTCVPTRVTAAKFGVKGSEQSAATAVLPGHVPPWGSGKDHTGFSPVCFHSAGAELGNSVPCPTSPSVPSPGRRSQPTGTLPAMGRPCPPWGQAALCSGGLPKAGGLLFPLRCVNR